MSKKIKAIGARDVTGAIVWADDKGRISLKNPPRMWLFGEPIHDAHRPAMSRDYGRVTYLFTADVESLLNVYKTRGISIQVDETRNFGTNTWYTEVYATFEPRSIVGVFKSISHDVLRAEEQVKVLYRGEVFPKPDYDSMVKPVLIQLATKGGRDSVLHLLERFGAPRGQDVMQKDLGLMFAMAKQMLANLNDYNETQMRLRVEQARLAAQKAGGTFVPASQVLAQSGKAQEMADALAADAISKGAQQVHDEFIFPAGGTPDSISSDGEMRDLKSTLSATQRFAIEEARNKAVSELFRDVTVKPTPGYVSVKCSPEFFDKVENATIDVLFKRIEKLEEKHRKATAWCAAFKYAADDAHRDLQYLREHGTETKPATHENKPSHIGDIFVDDIFVDDVKLGKVFSLKIKTTNWDKDALYAALYGTPDPLKKLLDAGIYMPTKAQCDEAFAKVTAEGASLRADVKERDMRIDGLIRQHIGREAAWQKKDQEWLAAFTQEQSARIEAERKLDMYKGLPQKAYLHKFENEQLRKELEEFKGALTVRLAELEAVEGQLNAYKKAQTIHLQKIEKLEHERAQQTTTHEGDYSIDDAHLALSRAFADNNCPMGAMTSAAMDIVKRVILDALNMGVRELQKLREEIEALNTLAVSRVQYEKLAEVNNSQGREIARLRDQRDKIKHAYAALSAANVSHNTRLRDAINTNESAMKFSDERAAKA